MEFVQKIYYSNKPLILTTNSAAYIQKHPEAAKYLLVKGTAIENYHDSMQFLDQTGTIGAIIEGDTAEGLQQQMHKIYEPIDAGGGVVKNEDGNVLMIYRRGKWDLPKGKRDDGEKIEDCAVREVAEETGLQQIELGKKICDTYHVYAQHNQHLLKRTSWYEMHTSVNEKLIPQEEENIEEVRWVSKSEMNIVMQQTYVAIKEVLQEAGIQW